MAAGKTGGLIGELGTGAGAGTAWLASGLAGGARLITMEIDPKLANAAKVIFESYPQVEFRIGEWHETIRNESFDLLFMDSGVQDDLRRANWNNMIAHIKLGGQIVMDDLTPAELCPAECKNITDNKREFALANSRAIGAEMRTTATTSALIMTRIY